MIFAYKFKNKNKLCKLFTECYNFPTEQTTEIVCKTKQSSG